MSDLIKLLEGVKVEWKTLGEISELYGGLKGKSKNDFTDGNAKYVTYKNIFNNIEINFDTLESVKVSPTENQYEIRYGDVLFTGSSEIASEAGMSSSVTKSSDNKIYLNSFSFGLRFNPEINLIPEFTKYLFRSKYMRDAIAKTASGVTRYNISKKRFVKLQIPIPCPDNPEKSLKIQQEIVRILDRLSEETNQLTEALQKELDLHQKRYDFYREELFKFEGKEVEWKCLGEAFDLKRGRRLIKSELETEGQFAVYQNSMTPLGYYHKSNVRADTTFLICAGSAGEIGYSKNDFWAADDVYYFEAPGSVQSKFLYYLLQNHQEYLLSKVRRSSVPRLSKDSFIKISIPIANLQEQERIVKILDDLDAETKAITIAIQKEIALRNKQYKYYRDRLLSFPSLQTISCSSLRAEGEAIQKKSTIPMNGGGSEGEAIQKNTTTQ